MLKKLSVILSVLFFCTTVLSAKGQVPEDSFENGESLKNPGLYALMDTTKGKMIFQLDYKNAPLTVMNFMRLADEEFYSGLQFYRVIENYAVFSGDPQNNGSSDAGYNFPTEYNKTLNHNKPGILTMDGVSGITNGSRFFITRTADPVLDEKYTAFGQLLEGHEVLADIKRKMVIKSLDIVKTGSEAQAFEVSDSEFDKLSSMALNRQLESFREKNPEVASVIDNMGDGIKKTLTGIYYKITTPGNGVKPDAGDLVSVHYIGRLIDGTVFDNSIARGVPFEFAVGTNAVITGWDESVMDMSVGEKRTVLIPPNLAYGDVQAGPIPPESWLMFEVELVGIK